MPERGQPSSSHLPFGGDGQDHPMPENREALSDRLTCLPPGTAEKVRLIVSEVFGGGWEGFQRYICEPAPFGGHEWRFQGALGFGGKLYMSRGQLYVCCYREDETPILKAAMAHVNRELAAAIDDERRRCARCFYDETAPTTAEHAMCDAEGGHQWPAPASPSSDVAKETT